MKMLLTMFLFSMIGFAHAGEQKNAEPSGPAEAYFAGGCFWCTESDFEKIPGVKEVVSGYSGGTTENPSYEQVSSGETEHRESIQVTYDPGVVSYAQLVEAFWKLKKKLTPMQYKVTQEDGTEPPFDNAYWDNKQEGIYVDVVSGEPLFSSRDKFQSDTGWPSFTRPLESKHILTREDRSLFMKRTEVRSRYADSHLGDVFEDGPEPTGLRYCMNSAALRFIPKEKLDKEGYGQYLDHFKE